MKKETKRKTSSERVRKWRLENPDKVKAYLARNRKKLNAQQREWAAKNPDKNGKWGREHPEERREFFRAWAARNPEKVSFHGWQQRQKRRKKEAILKKAAPALLKALEALLTVADHPSNPMRGGANASLIADARAAIAKATGEGGAV